MNNDYLGFFEVLAENVGCEFTKRKGKTEFAYVKNVQPETDVHYQFELTKGDTSTLTIKVMIGKGLNQHSFDEKGANWYVCYAGVAPLNKYFALQLLVHIGVEKHTQ